MPERVIKIIKATAKGKKYTAIVRDSVTKKERKVNFGSSINDQYKDLTPLKLYSSKDHGDLKRRKNFLQRMSKGATTKAQALANEKGDKITPKYLSIKYLW